MTDKNNSDNGTLANVTPLSLIPCDNYLDGGALSCGAVMRLFRAGVALPDGGFIGFQAELETYKTFAFSSRDVYAAEEDFNWIFEKCAAVSPGAPGIKEDLAEENRVVYVLTAVKDGSPVPVCRNETEALPSGEFLLKMIRMMNEDGAVVRVCVGKAPDGAEGHGKIMISLPQQMTLRMRSMLSTVFPGTEAVAAGGAGCGGYIPDGMFTDGVSRMLYALMRNSKEQELQEPEYIDEDIFDFDGDGFDDWQFTPIDELDLSVRALNSLKRAGVESVEQLKKLSDEDLMHIRHFTQRCVDEVKEKLAEHYREKKAAQPDNTDYMAMLDGMTGLAEAKEQIGKIAAFAKMKKALSERGRRDLPLTLNMEFVGNPGTGKTTVARIVARILYQTGILPCADVIEAGRADVVAKYVGHTAARVKELFQRAQGKLLFIDEAYSLVDCRENDFGDEAIHAIVQEMENNRDKTVVIFAGYPDKMAEFFNRNPGLRSRVPFSIRFEDYSAEEMAQIADLEAGKRGFGISGDAREKIIRICKEVSARQTAGNGRFCRNLVENAILCYASRVYGEDGGADNADCILTDTDFILPDGETENKKTRIGFCA